MKEQPVVRHFLIECPRRRDHNKKIQEFSQEKRDYFPDHRKYIGKYLQPPHAVQFFGQKFLHQRDLFQRIENRVHPVSVSQRKRNPQCFIHVPPP